MNLFWNILVLAAALACPVAADIPDSVPVASVNGHPVFAAEIRLAMDRYRAEVISYFAQRNAHINSPYFWNQSMHGEIPASILKNKALDYCIGAKVRQILALEQGLIADISYLSILRQRSEENPLRRKIADAGGIVYGPVEYDEDSYFQYIMNYLASDLKSKMEKEMVIPEPLLRERYEKENHLCASCPPSQEILLVRVDNGGNPIDTAAISALRLKMISRSDCQNLNALKFGSKPLKITCERFLMDKNLLQAREKMGKLVAIKIDARARDLAAGEVGPAFDFKEGIAIVKCLSRGEPVRVGFDEARGRIQEEIIGERFDDIISARRRSAAVHVEQALLDQITVH